MKVQTILLILVSLTLAVGQILGGVLVNNAQPITRRVTVQIVQAAASDGSNAAPVFGTPAQQKVIFQEINQIWAQAGVEIDFKFRPATWNWNFALLGSSANNNPRPGGDLVTMVTAASQFGVNDPDPNVINVYLVRVVPGFSQTSDNTCNGQSLNGQNGVTLWIGPNTPTSSAGLDLVAHILAHELGLNLGLKEITGDPNLMLPIYTPGEVLIPSQNATVSKSSFAISVDPASTNPSVAIMSPTDQGLSLQPQVIIQGTASDARGISGVMVNGVAATSIDSFATWSAAITGLTPGLNTLTIVATDAVTPGNAASISWHVSYVADLLAYALNGDPVHSGNAVLPAPTIETNPTDSKPYLTFTYHRLITPAAITYNVEVSSDLMIWSSDAANFEEISSPVADPNGVTETVHLRILPAIGVVGDFAKFVRLMVSTAP